MKTIGIAILIALAVMVIAFIGGVLTFDSQPDWAVDGHPNQVYVYRSNHY